MSEKEHKMKSIPVAITWELLHKGGWNFVVGFLGGNLIPILIFGFFRRVGVDLQDPSLVMIHSSLLLTNMFLFSMIVLFSVGRPSRLYAYPIPTSTLVACQLFPAMVLVGLEIFLSSVLLNAMFDLQVPLWSPALFAATVIGWFLSTLWFTEKTAWLPVAEGLVTGVLGIWFHCRFSRPDHPLNQHWIASIPGELLILFVTVIVSFFVGNISMARNRCGEQLKPLGILAWIYRVFDFAPADQPAFRSAAEAHAWYEWRLKGWALPITVVFGLFVGLSIWVIFIRDPKELISGFLGGGGMLSAVAMIWAIIIGNVGPLDSNFEMGHFLASRPMTSKDMARTILKMTAQSVLLSWALWAGAFLIVAGILFATGNAPQPFFPFPSEISWIYFPATLLGCWTVVSVLASFGLMGRTTLVAQLFCGLFASYMGVICFSAFVLSDAAQRQFFAGITALWGIAFAVGTILLFVAARKRDLIELPMIAGSCCLWLIISAAAVTRWLRDPTLPFVGCIFFIGVAALVVAPLAAAPLALAWNRTR
jgi:hypothetical protein